jgi:hypothetical protein
MRLSITEEILDYVVREMLASEGGCVLEARLAAKTHRRSLAVLAFKAHSKGLPTRRYYDAKGNWASYPMASHS